MVGAVFTEIFVADVFIAVFSVCTAYITAFVAKKLHFVFLLSGEIGEFIQGFVQAKVVYKLRKLGEDFCGRGHKIEVGIILFQI